MATKLEKKLALLTRPQENLKNPKIQKVDRRHFNKGTGRKKTTTIAAEVMLIPTRRKNYEDIAMYNSEIVSVNERDKTGAITERKMTRLMVALELLFKEVKPGHLAGINAYLDRVLGRPLQPLGGDDSAPPIRIEVGPLIDKIYAGYHSNNESE